MLSKLLSLLGLAALASAAPLGNHTLTARSFSCSNPVAGLTQSDCQYLSNIGFAGTGSNPHSNNGHIWIGTDGPNTITFHNNAQNPNADVVMVLWDQSHGDSSSFLAANPPVLTISMAYGSSVTVSLANGVSGAWTALYRHVTILTQYGQVYNTWAEFTTGQYATVDISRLVNMGGNQLVAQVSTGCKADNTQCAYVCKSGNACYESGTYSLIGCNQPNSNAYYGGADPEGGCGGWANGGHIDATFL
ncbi:hypothetical protein QBC46DRAFT_425779 [Diplogelasinospora grovesii]|uniref:Uncharacterized protein n=1 Tax=Diplogelasinospora grovesii TaxID=303347 RepID=A0AAN6NBB9_9PEZI|nr:hypothetical protein QBC46DRAFT_425779 [Diplogelasinospora grovesii]